MNELGGPTTFNHYPVGWAHAMDTPFQWTKQIASHFGGTRNGMVISWPARIKDKGGLRNQFSSVIDIMPTILEAAGVPAPTSINGVAQKPIEGTSLVYSFDDARAPSKHTTQYFEMFGNRAIYHDGWVAATTPGVAPWDSAAEVQGRLPPVLDYKWELYNVSNDFSVRRAESRPLGTPRNEAAARGCCSCRRVHGLRAAAAGASREENRPRDRRYNPGSALVVVLLLHAGRQPQVCHQEPDCRQASAPSALEGCGHLRHGAGARGPLLQIKGFEPRYEIGLEVLENLPYKRWQESDPEDSLRFHTLRLYEVGMIKTNPNRLIAQGTDWRFLNELKKELRA